MILFAHDDWEARETVVLTLRDDGVEAVGSATGELAERLQGTDIHCLVTTDPAVESEAHRLHPTLPVVLLHGRMTYRAIWRGVMAATGQHVPDPSWWRQRD